MARRRAPAIPSGIGHPQERPGFHGMVLVGRRSAYLSHLPMFHSPQDYQAVFEVSLTVGDTAALPMYERSRGPAAATSGLLLVRRPR
jgi:hypothetical protein